MVNKEDGTNIKKYKFGIIDIITKKRGEIL
jgi:hypothetical protein